MTDKKKVKDEISPLDARPDAPGDAPPDAPGDAPDDEVETAEDLDAAADDFLKAVAGEDPEEAEDAEPPADGELPPTYEELQEQTVTLKDQLLRALAEADNTRRRTGREKSDMSKYAVTNFARSVLSVADNLRRALDSVSLEAREHEALNNLCIGVELTEKELDTAYEQFGIKAIDAEGKRFDHNLHQAMFEIEDPDQPAGMVLKVMQKGYVIHDRLLRPAMVGVSKGGPKLEKETPAQAEIKTKEKSEEEADNKAGEKPKSEVERQATSRSKAYEKQSDAADQESGDSQGQLDKEL